MEICLSAHLKFLPISFEATESSVQTFSKVRPALCPAVNFRTKQELYVNQGTCPESTLGSTVVDMLYIFIFLFVCLCVCFKCF